MKVSRTWLQTYFEQPLPPADEVARLLTFHAFEVEGVERVGDDAVIDIDVLANRSSDCLSHRGIARELSTLLGIPMKYDPLREPIPAIPPLKDLFVEVDDKTLCPRYMAVVLRGVHVQQSPQWLVERLTTLGHRSINNVVDATNVVMLALGQPLHAFDLDKLTMDTEGMRGIRVRSATSGEPITVLSGETYTLNEERLLVSDSVSGTPLALAGVKGGKEAEVTEHTTDIVLESANFEHVAVRKTSQTLKLATEASVRFQNEPSPLLVPIAMRDVVKLILEVAGGSVVGGCDVSDEVAMLEPVTCTLDEMSALLGTKVTRDEVERTLVRLEADFSFQGERVTVTPPWERTDLTSPQDLIEEIGRIQGYENLPSRVPTPGTMPNINSRFHFTEKLRHLLHELGYSEVYTYTLHNKGEVELENPLASDKSFLRNTLRDGLVEALDRNVRNAPLLGLDSVKLFELGHVFSTQQEILTLALGVRAHTPKHQKATLAQLEQDIATLNSLYHLGASLPGGEEVVEVSLEQALLRYDAPITYDPPLPWNVHARFTTWSTFPFALRDIALWVPHELPVEEITAVIVATASDMLVRHDLFDEFSKGEQKSYAFHLVFQATDRTLTDEEVSAEMSAIEATCSARGWTIR